MSAEDRLRNHLRNTAASMPAGPGSLDAVQARAGQRQRRRNAGRSSVGTFALVAVAAIGLVTLRSGDIGDEAAADDYTESAGIETATTATASDAAMDMADDDMADDDMDEEGIGDESMADDDMAETEDSATGSFAGGGAMSESDDDGGRAGFEMDEESASGESVDEESADASVDVSASEGGAVFAAAVSVVSPPDQAGDTALRYSFSGTQATAHDDDDWYAYDGAGWRSLGLPEGIEVVAVDLSTTERIAVFGVVRPMECVVEQVVAVRERDRWSYVRVGDDTPSTVSSELLEAKLFVTDDAVELERHERLWLSDECADTSQNEALTDEAAKLIEELKALGEVRRRSWQRAAFEPDFAQHWPRAARSDASSAALDDSGLRWESQRSPRYSVDLRELTPSQRPSQDVAAEALHETMILDVESAVHVSDGSAWLRRGEQEWEVCPIPTLDEASAEVGQVGESLAVVIGKPEQTLFVIARTE